MEGGDSIADKDIWLKATVPSNPLTEMDQI